MKRELPKGVSIEKTINEIPLYKMNIFQNIMSWNQHNLNIPALEYFGTQISYGELPGVVEAYAKGFACIGIKQGSVITMSLPVSIENIVSLFAVSQLGAISNNVNFLFLRNNLVKYTKEKKSDTIIILDIYLPLISKQLKNSGIKNIILTSLEDYLPDNNRDVFSNPAILPKKIREVITNPQKMAECSADIQELSDVRIINMRDVIALGENVNFIEYPPIDIERDSIYSYTSGTTGEPKCIVFKEQSPNAIIEMHNGLDLRDYVGDRSLVVIPSSHATGMFYATYLQLAKGKTLVLQPIYDKNTFADDLKNFKINHTLAAASFYLAAVANDNLVPGDLDKLARPCSGGEPITKSNTELINQWLKKNGCREKIAIGGGAGEVGSSALTSYELNTQTKTNETGFPIPGVYVKLVDEMNGSSVKIGQRGIIQISSAASADRYLDNPKATDEYFYYDDKGTKWAILGDIAVQNEDGSYNMLGRASDSYEDISGEIVYLFDTEYALSSDDPVIEWEITAFKTNTKYVKVAQVILKKDFIGNEYSAICYLCKKYDLDSVKLFKSFPTSEVTGKRNYQLIKSQRSGYYAPCTESQVYEIDYIENDIPLRRIKSIEDIKIDEIED